MDNEEGDSWRSRPKMKDISKKTDEQKKKDY